MSHFLYVVLSSLLLGLFCIEFLGKPSFKPTEFNSQTEQAEQAFPILHSLVLVLSSQEDLYRPHKEVWRMLADDAPRYGFKVYYIAMNPNIDRLTIDGNEINVPGSECLLPCPLIKTIAALEALCGESASGYAYEYVLRTNLSSFWVWARLLEWMEEKLLPRGKPIRAGKVGYADQNDLSASTSFVSGAGTLWSIDVVRMIIHGNETLNYNEQDDIAISSFLNKKNIPIEEMQRTDYTSGEVHPIITLPPRADTGAYHYRVKSVNDRERYDGYLMARLYAETYSVNN